MVRHIRGEIVSLNEFDHSFLVPWIEFHSKAVFDFVHLFLSSTSLSLLLLTSNTTSTFYYQYANFIPLSFCLGCYYFSTSFKRNR